MKFTIETINKSEKNKLITAQTCFNSIVLPDYKTKEEMKKSITLSSYNFIILFKYYLFLVLVLFSHI